METFACNTPSTPVVQGAADPAAARLPRAWAAVCRGWTKLPQFLRAVKPLRTHAWPVSPPAWSLGASGLSRRQDARVRDLGAQMPRLTFDHPLRRGAQICLCAVDIGATGCAIIETSGVLPLIPGTVLRAVEVELDDEAMLFTDVVVQNVSPPETVGSDGPRVGLRWQRMPAPAQQRLERWIARSIERQRQGHASVALAPTRMVPS
jgi:hypothetical protein